MSELREDLIAAGATRPREASEITRAMVEILKNDQRKKRPNVR